MASYSCKIMLPSELNVDELTFAEPKKFGDAGGKIIYINLNRSKFSICAPKMRTPFGLQKYEEPGKPPKYTLDLSFGDYKNNPALKAFYDSMKAFDEKVIKMAQDNSLNWFKKKSLSDNLARELYSSSIKFSKDKETGEPNEAYPPTFKTKLNYRDGSFQCEVFDKEKNRVETPLEDSIPKGQELATIIESNGIWIAGGKFGTSWRVSQMKIGKPGLDKKAYAFRDDAEDLPL